jgi:hypothetical protein
VQAAPEKSEPSTESKTGLLAKMSSALAHHEMKEQERKEARSSIEMLILKKVAT